MAVCCCAIGQHPLLTTNDVLHVWGNLNSNCSPNAEYVFLILNMRFTFSQRWILLWFMSFSRYSSVALLSYPPSSTSSKLSCPHLSLTEEPHRPITANTQLSMASYFTLNTRTVPHLRRHCTRFATQLIHRPSLHPGLIGSDCGIYTFCR